MNEFTLAYKASPTAFLQNEKKRVEGFEPIYKQTLIASTALLLIALALFWIINSSTYHAIGMALILLALSAQTFDYFSRERATHYLEQIKNNSAQ